MSKTTIQKLAELGKEYLEYSQSIFGWQTTYIHKLDNNSFCLSTESYGSLGHCYFALEDNFNSIAFDAVRIYYHNPPSIQYDITEDLGAVLNKYSSILTQIKEYHKNQSEEESIAEKAKLKESLLRQLEALNK